jgi:hypothetical protein
MQQLLLSVWGESSWLWPFMLHVFIDTFNLNLVSYLLSVCPICFFYGSFFLFLLLDKLNIIYVSIYFFVALLAIILGFIILVVTLFIT